jgi:hypothetical protein
MSYKSKFSLLEKDEKTFNHVKLYYDALENCVDLVAIDIKIQRNEFDWHLNHCKAEDKRSEECAWIEKNASALRQYLNSLKAIALFCYMDNKIYYRDRLVFEVYCKICEIYNKEKSLIMDSIYMIEK